MTTIADRAEILHNLIVQKRLFTWLPEPQNIFSVLSLILNELPLTKQSDSLDMTYDIIIKVPPTSYGIWFNNQVEFAELGKILANDIVYGTNVSNNPPVFHIFGDPQLLTGDIQISVVQYTSTSNDTSYLDSSAIHNNVEDGLVLTPFLIDQNSQTTCITKTAFNIGRRIDNDLVIDDARVSRQHAQIRFSPKGCILFDLNSTGGTFINNMKIVQQKLQSGDVISLAGATLVYGEEAQKEDGLGSMHPNHSETKPPIFSDDDHLEYIG
jgi:hypothetical protein